MSLLVENQLFPSVNYFKNLSICKNLLIELCESYQKMSFRNRYVIYGANGLIHLSVPVAGGREQKKIITEVEIDFADNWHVKHWRAILSSYSKAPFFDYYATAVKGLIFSKVKLLSDYNTDALNWCLATLKMQPEIFFTSDYKKIYEDVVDYRNIILPKNFQLRMEHLSKYPQVFEDRFGFQANLSILDLIFNEGPNARHVIESVK